MTGIEFLFSVFNIAADAYVCFDATVDLTGACFLIFLLSMMLIFIKRVNNAKIIKLH